MWSARDAEHVPALHDCQRRSRDLPCRAIWSPITVPALPGAIAQPAGPEAGFGKRVLFDSDQMIWPDAMELAIEASSPPTS
jgi:hypothetical protein